MHPSTPTEQQADSLSSMGIDMRHPHPSGGGWGSHLGSHHLSNPSAVARAYYATHMIFNSAGQLFFFVLFFVSILLSLSDI